MVVISDLVVILPRVIVPIVLIYALYSALQSPNGGSRLHIRLLVFGLAVWLASLLLGLANGPILDQRNVSRMVATIAAAQMLRWWAVLTVSAGLLGLPQLGEGGASSRHAGQAAAGFSALAYFLSLPGLLLTAVFLFLARGSGLEKEKDGVQDAIGKNLRWQGAFLLLDIAVALIGLAGGPPLAGSGIGPLVSIAFLGIYGLARVAGGVYAVMAAINWFGGGSFSYPLVR